MSGTPYWLSDAVGKDILINGKETVLRDGYCVGCRSGVPNSDELVLVTDAGTFNTSDHQWELPPRTRRQLGWA
jgi:hypothetical protein